jgi:hypothetical protein
MKKKLKLPNSNGIHFKCARSNFARLPAKYASIQVVLTLSFALAAVIHLMESASTNILLIKMMDFWRSI